MNQSHIELVQTLVSDRISRATERSNQGHTMMLYTNIPTKFQLPTPYSCQNIARTRFYRSRSLWQGQRSSRSDRKCNSFQIRTDLLNSETQTAIVK